MEIKFNFTKRVSRNVSKFTFIHWGMVKNGENLMQLMNKFNQKDTPRKIGKCYSENS